MRANAQSCPFCASSSLQAERRFVDGPLARVSLALGAAGFAASLNACYGAPRGGGYAPARPSGPNGTYVKAVDDENEALVHVEASARAAGCTVSRTENVVRAECSFESFSISTGKRKLIVSCLSKVGDECQMAYEKISPKD